MPDVICGMSLTLRFASPSDAELIADISQQTFYESFIADNRPEDMDKFLTEQFTRGKLMMEVGAKDHIFILAYDGEEIAGYVKLRDGKVPDTLDSAKALEVARIYCLKEKIGKGVGRLLMQKSVDIAKEKDKDTLWLGVWEKNTRAINFYYRWGFEKFDETDFLLGDDVQRDWLMKKKV